MVSVVTMVSHGANQSLQLSGTEFLSSSDVTCPDSSDGKANQSRSAAVTWGSDIRAAFLETFGRST